jgi:hypothetical protein
MKNQPDSKWLSYMLNFTINLLGKGLFNAGEQKKNDKKYRILTHTLEYQHQSGGK